MRHEVSQIYKVPDEKIIVIQPSTSNWIDEILESYRKAIKAASKSVAKTKGSYC
jgi:hypothetical protein